MDHNVKAKTSAPLPNFSEIWMGYFIMTIGLVGFPLCAGLIIPFHLISFIWQPAQRPADWIMRWGIGILMRIQPWFNGDIELEVPPGGVLLVSNHRSHLDVFVLLSRVQGIRVLAKSSLFFIPFLGIMMWASGQIPTRRGDVKSFLKAMDSIRKKLKSGETVHVFPEMTRCQPGFQGTADFLVAPFLAAKESGRPVVPLVIQGTDGVWPKGRFAIRFGFPVRMRTLEPLDPAQFENATALKAETQRRINSCLAIRPRSNAELN